MGGIVIYKLGIVMMIEQKLLFLGEKEKRMIHSMGFVSLAPQCAENEIKKWPMHTASLNVSPRTVLFGEAGKFQHFDHDPLIDFFRRTLGGILPVFDVPD